LGVIKEIDQAYKESGKAEQFKSLQYVEREEDAGLKQMFEQERERLDKLSERMYGKVDGEIDMDLHGNITVKPVQTPEEKAKSKKEGIDEAGTYILRDGKLVKGKAEIREQATFSNWYCSNADPEDIRRHRELMDRMHYRGPKWEGIGIPKSVIEEENPVYAPREAEQHPSLQADAEEGKKEFEHVVR
jgi:hypothetical protein